MMAIKETLMNTSRRMSAPRTIPEPRTQAAELLAALERLRAELGGVADELIILMRSAGIRPPGELDASTPLLH